MQRAAQQGSSSAAVAAAAAARKGAPSLVEQITERRQRRLALNTFEALTETQASRSASPLSARPAVSRSPPSVLALTHAHLLAAQAHIGHSVRATHRAYLPHVYGTRAGACVIDSRQTLAALRRASAVLRDTVARDGVVLFVGSRTGIGKAVEENAERCNAPGEGATNGFPVTRWKPGTITNANEVLRPAVPAVEALEQQRRLAQEGSSGSQARHHSSSSSSSSAPAPPAQLRPSLLVLLSPTLDRHALKEATLAGVPTIGVVDSDVDPRAVTYPIYANDDSPRAVELIAGVLGMAGKDGQRIKLDVQRKSAEMAARRQQHAERRARGAAGSLQARDTAVDAEQVYASTQR